MRRFVGITALTMGVLLTTVAPAGAAKVKVDFRGGGSYVILGDGSAALTGTATGEPLDGPYQATLVPTDGTLPEPGVCEPATATVRLEGAHNRFLDLTAGGRVCGQYLQPPNVVTEVFTGRYQVTAASRKPLVGTDGFLEVRLANDGRAFVFAIDT